MRSIGANGEGSTDCTSYDFSRNRSQLPDLISQMDEAFSLLY